MKYIWVASTEYSHTLFKQHPDHKIPQKMAWVSCVFPSDNHPRPRWRVRIVATGEPCTALTLQEAKDWAQAVILLTQ